MHGVSHTWTLLPFQCILIIMLSVHLKYTQCIPEVGCTIPLSLTVSPKCWWWLSFYFWPEYQIASWTFLLRRTSDGTCLKVISCTTPQSDLLLPCAPFPATHSVMQVRHQESLRFYSLPCFPWHHNCPLPTPHVLHSCCLSISSCPCHLIPGHLCGPQVPISRPPDHTASNILCLCWGKSTLLDPSLTWKNIIEITYTWVWRIINCVLTMSLTHCD
jgi:hypothetical protein